MHVQPVSAVPGFVSFPATFDSPFASLRENAELSRELLVLPSLRFGRTRSSRPIRPYGATANSALLLGKSSLKKRKNESEKQQSKKW